MILKLELALLLLGVVAAPVLASTAAGIGLSSNGTESNGSGGGGGNTNNSPELLVRSLMPLLGGSFGPLGRSFAPLYRTVGSYFGVDPTAILTLLGFFWAANKFGRQLCSGAYAVIKEHLMSNIQINSGDDIYLHVMRWLATQPGMVNSRSLTAETISKTAWEAEAEGEEEFGASTAARLISPDGSGVVLNYANHEAKAAPRFTPALGVHGFWFRGRYFRLLRKQESLYDDGGQSTRGIPQFKDREVVTVSCFGRSPEPIKALLQHAKEQYYRDHHAKTTVKRPNPQSARRFGSRHSWFQVAERPVRPLKTVVLDDEQKMQVLTDMNEYLHPATPRWYANRGIPLRRGYLFHGPPGTGKTSLSFALAGLFGLDIHVISLLDPTLTEEDLLGLFNGLPRRCIVLLEDIDIAGLGRAPELPIIPESDPAPAPAPDPSSTTSTTTPAPTSTTTTTGNKEGRPPHHRKTAGDKPIEADWKVSDLARELRKHSGGGSGGGGGIGIGGGDREREGGISLSGLLNAIDGVASHEGRVLIMTTNKPEALDEALIRPGRIDLQVAFSNATREQARQLFVRMYEADQHQEQEQEQEQQRKKKEKEKENGKASSEEDDMSGNGDSATPLLTVNGVADGVLEDGKEKEKEKEENREQEQEQKQASSDERFDLGGADLSSIAAEFAAKIPPGQFSPAELQGFLLKRKTRPRRALAEVDRWVATMLQQKANRSKVLRVQ